MDIDKKRSIEILDEILRVYKITISELADRLEVSVQTLYSIKNTNKSTTISKKIAELMSKKLENINKSYLLTGEGELLKSDNENLRLAENRYSKSFETIAKAISKAMEDNSELSKDVVQLAKDAMEISKEYAQSYSKSVDTQKNMVVLLKELMDKLSSNK